MDKNEIKNKLEKYKTAYVTKFKYDEKQYVKAIKSLKNGIKYIYYEIKNDDLNEIDDKDLIEYFENIYGMKASDTIY